MTTDPPWQSRWRSESHYQGHYQFDSTQPVRAPQTPASVVGYHTSPSLPISVDYHARPWDGKSRAEPETHSHGATSMIGRYADASAYHSWLHGRHTSPGHDRSLNDSPAGQGSTQPWHSLPVDHYSQNRYAADGSLTLHIPQTNDLPKIPRSYPPNSTHQLDNQGSLTQHSTSLPPFASLSEHASRTDDPDEVEIAPMSARLPCSSCTKLTPLIREVALSVAELDDDVQQYCNKSATRTLDFPKDNPILAAQWILERLSKTKADLQETARRMQSGSHYTPPNTSIPGISSRNASPPGVLKRSADRWDHEELPAPKRPRSGASFDELSRTMSNTRSKDDRRGSLDFGNRSPLPTESMPGSAYPRMGSPGLSTRPSRALPSPSSQAYPPSAAPSLAPPTAFSIGSPTTSCQPAVSIHTASASSATSEHIADLQHQVTLKSLALQTLQSEYASLLQKLQRERVKSQTIEKKTSVADQEVNELTSRNEDLTEQIKTLETQLEESEKKRDSERLTAAAERDQWTKLLAMDRQLQSKNAEEKQRLREEKSQLSQRVAAYEDESFSRFDPGKRHAPRTSATELEPQRIRDREESDFTPAATTDGLTGDATNTNFVESLRSEIVALNKRIEILRFSLEDAKRRSERLGDISQEIVERNTDIRSAIDRVLEEDAPAKTVKAGPQPQPSGSSGHSTPVRQKPTWSPTVPPIYPHSSRTLSQSPPIPPELPSTMHSASSSITMASMASIARAVSPGPAELGFHVTPSTSSPEELVAALGPVPSPMQFASSFGGGKKGVPSAQRKKPRKQNPESSVASTQTGDDEQFGGFRPLTHPVPSQHSGLGRVADYVETVSAYASSHGSMVEGTSSSSSQTESRRSSAEDKNAANVVKVEQSTFTAGLPPIELANGFHSISAMPPPPRPSMNLRDLCSMPTGSIVNP